MDRVNTAAIPARTVVAGLAGVGAAEAAGGLRFRLLRLGHRLFRRFGADCDPGQRDHRVAALQRARMLVPGESRANVQATVELTRLMWPNKTLMGALVSGDGTARSAIYHCRLQDGRLHPSILLAAAPRRGSDLGGRGPHDESCEQQRLSEIRSFDATSEKRLRSWYNRARDPTGQLREALLESLIEGNAAIMNIITRSLPNVDRFRSYANRSAAVRGG
jgi:hypothetical protein